MYSRKTSQALRLLQQLHITNNKIFCQQNIFAQALRLPQQLHILVCLICTPYMYALYVRLICTPYIYAYMYALYVYRICPKYHRFCVFLSTCTSLITKYFANITKYFANKILCTGPPSSSAAAHPPALPAGINSQDMIYICICIYICIYIQQV